MSGIALELLSEQEVANLLQVSPRTVQSWRLNGFGPPFIKVGRLVRYQKSEVFQFLADNKHASTSA